MPPAAGVMLDEWEISLLLSLLPEPSARGFYPVHVKPLAKKLEAALVEVRKLADGG